MSTLLYAILLLLIWMAWSRIKKLEVHVEYLYERLASLATDVHGQ